MGKWTDNGFIAYSLQTYKDQLGAAFKEAYGADFDTNDATEQGILIQRIAELIFNTDMDGIQAWTMQNINTMSGSMLDIVGGYRGIPRNQGSYQILSVNVTAVAANFQPYTIPAGTVFTLVGSDDTFTNTNAITIETPNASILLDYTEYGNSDAIVGSLLQVNGFGQITNLEVTNVIAGQPAESDLDYRRRLQTEYPAANNTIEWVENKLLESPLVRVVGANYNDQSTEQGGIAAYCTEWMAVPVSGANTEAFEQAVGTIIINNKVPSSPTDGNTTVTVTDIFGTQKEVKFTIPTQVELEIDVRLTTPETTGFLDLSNVPNIREQIATYINNLEIGKDVSYSRCAAPLFADQGFDVQYFQIRQKGTTDWVENANFTIGPRQYASISESDITIGV